MSLTDAHRSIEDKIVSFFYKPDIFQVLSGKSWRELHTAVSIPFEGLVSRKTCSFDQTVPFVLFPAGYLPLKGCGEVLDLFRGTVLPDHVWDRGSQEQGLAAGQNTFFQFGTGSGSDHDASTSFPLSFWGRNA
jgi:hypothetical protein